MLKDYGHFDIMLEYANKIIRQFDEVEAFKGLDEFSETDQSLAKKLYNFL